MKISLDFEQLQDYHKTHQRNEFELIETDYSCPDDQVVNADASVL